MASWLLLLVAHVGHGAQVAGHGSPTAGHDAIIAGYGVPTTSHMHFLQAMHSFL